jgi:hypothetical protein
VKRIFTIAAATLAGLIVGGAGMAEFDHQMGSSGPHSVTIILTGADGVTTKWGSNDVREDSHGCPQLGGFGYVAADLLAPLGAHVDGGKCVILLPPPLHASAN